MVKNENSYKVTLYLKSKKGEKQLLSKILKQLSNLENICVSGGKLDSISHADWIPVSNGLPTDPDDVVIVAWVPDKVIERDEHPHFYGLSSFDPDNGWDVDFVPSCWNGEDLGVTILAWMPLPEHYIEDSCEDNEY